MRKISACLVGLALASPVSAEVNPKTVFAPAIENDLRCATLAVEAVSAVDKSESIWFADLRDFYLGRLSGRDENVDWYGEALVRNPWPGTSAAKAAQLKTCAFEQNRIIMRTPTPKAP